MYGSVIPAGAAARLSRRTLRAVDVTGMVVPPCIATTFLWRGLTPDTGVVWVSGEGIGSSTIMKCMSSPRYGSGSAAKRSGSRGPITNRVCEHFGCELLPCCSIMGAVVERSVTEAVPLLCRG
jgi:hypothetical protein